MTTNKKQKRIDLTGKKFGRLTALSFSHKSNWGKSYWNFQCDCGNQKKILSGMVTQGKSKSCGCLHKEIVTIHGMNKDKFYKVFQDIKSRCCNKHNAFYKDYGGRGIKNEWKSFEAFKTDMYESYLLHLKLFKHNTSIDRMDVNKNYSKENCRWATATEQQRNRRDNQVYVFEGKPTYLIDLAKKVNIGYATLHSRLNCLGWSITKALTTPIQ